VVGAWSLARGLWFVGLAAAALAVSVAVATTPRAPATALQPVRFGGGGGFHLGSRLTGSRPSIGLFAGSSGPGFIVVALLIFGLIAVSRRRRRRVYPRF
jgi:MYXO-CTERM domain-containing protein